jgi:hypothetical protein
MQILEDAHQLVAQPLESLDRYAGGAISWMSQRQPVVATSTTEAESIAANQGAKDAIWLSRVFREIIQLRDVLIIQVDNSAAVRLA